ncbi:probable F-box protein At5g04010 [Rhodamnia argentea]|uniref:F-box protein n=1 Tax=Rhodamnia argentea TaxID=178133 RepID=A0A8B8NUX6_9MYRT|nr:probable F-box protein At5g04010 [Rhodamnia argentea]
MSAGPPPQNHPPPPWEVVLLVSHHLDPKTLAVASCVCKSWCASMSSDNLWKPVCASHFPSLSALQSTHPALPYRRLYALGLAAARCRARAPAKPHLSLDDLTFVVDVWSQDLHITTMSKPGDEIAPDPNRLFRFELVADEERLSAMEIMDHVRITWIVALRGWKAVFTMMECEGKASFIPGAEGWFSQELPSPECCSSATASGLVADLKLGFGSRNVTGGRIKVERVSVGILSMSRWRYASMEDGLRYLQNFLA